MSLFPICLCISFIVRKYLLHMYVVDINFSVKWKSHRAQVKCWNSNSNNKSKTVRNKRKVIPAKARQITIDIDISSKQNTADISSEKERLYIKKKCSFSKQTKTFRMDTFWVESPYNMLMHRTKTKEKQKKKRKSKKSSTKIEFRANFNAWNEKARMNRIEAKRNGMIIIRESLCVFKNHH